MKYYTIVFPGEYGQHVQETWSTDQILKSYYPYWCGMMIQNVAAPDLSEVNCIDDWITVHWAMETDQFGNKLCQNTSNNA
jgi:hypothetical protein